jgi:hypothetical protein
MTQPASPTNPTTQAVEGTGAAKTHRRKLPMPDAENCRDRLLWFDHRVGNYLAEHDLPRSPDLLGWWMRDLDRKDLEKAFISMFTLVVQGTEGLQSYDNQFLSEESREKRRIKWLREYNSDLSGESRPSAEDPTQQPPAMHDAMPPPSTAAHLANANLLVASLNNGGNSATNNTPVKTTTTMASPTSNMRALPQQPSPSGHLPRLPSDNSLAKLSGSSSHLVQPATRGANVPGAHPSPTGGSNSPHYPLKPTAGLMSGSHGGGSSVLPSMKVGGGSGHR